jgi:N-acetylglucosaminyl-diphospho-decaprenol L-rhamnosyltransferase
MASGSKGSAASVGRHGFAVDIVIVNWNSRAHLRECLAALDRSTIAERLNVIVVDNASADGSAEALVTERAPLDVVRNAENRGFAAACNQGAERGAAPVLLFLNPDVRVRPDAVAAAARYLEDPDRSDVGVLGAQLMDADGHVQRCCARTPTAATLMLQTLFLDRLFPALVPPHFLTEWDHGDTRPVDQVMGAFLMIRRTLFETLGGFDERFFLYYEDVDLCLAARQAGWTVLHYAGAQAEHRGGGTTSMVKDRRLFHVATSRVEYTAKRHGTAVAMMLIVLILGFEMPFRWLHASVTRSPQEGFMVIRGMALFWQNLSTISRRIRAGA